MVFKKIFNGRALCVDRETIWVAKGMSFYGIDYNGKCVTPIYRVGTIAEKFAGKFRLLRQLLRIGIHHLVLLKNENILVVLKKRTLIIDKYGNIISKFSEYKGNKPSHRGVCITPDGTVFLGEYSLNLKRENDTRLFRSTDNGNYFNCILTFPQNEVCHIHFIQWDKYENCLWLGTGDKDHECKLLKSIDNGDTWQTIGAGSQMWRSVGISCTEDALYWGTDAGSVPDKNYIIRMDRRTCKVEKLMELEGPCHGNVVLDDDTVFVSTGVEGGENEKDRIARLRKVSRNGIELIHEAQKDIFPLILQYGVMRFPIGMESTHKIIFTEYALKKGGEVVHISNE